VGSSFCETLLDIPLSPRAFGGALSVNNFATAAGDNLANANSLANLSPVLKTKQLCSGTCKARAKLLCLRKMPKKYFYNNVNEQEPILQRLHLQLERQRFNRLQSLGK
jgi:hypothetical protein